MFPRFVVLGVKLAALKWPVVFGTAAGVVTVVAQDVAVPNTPLALVTMGSLMVAFGIGGWCAIIQKQTVAAHARLDEWKAERRERDDHLDTVLRDIGDEIVAIGKYIERTTGKAEGVAEERQRSTRTRKGDA